MVGKLHISDIFTGYKIYYWTEYKQQHTTTAHSSNTIEDSSPNTIHHISLRIQKTEQKIKHYKSQDHEYRVCL